MGRRVTRQSHGGARQAGTLISSYPRRACKNKFGIRRSQSSGVFLKEKQEFSRMACSYDGTSMEEERIISVPHLPVIP